MAAIVFWQLYKIILHSRGEHIRDDEQRERERDVYRLYIQLSENISFLKELWSSMRLNKASETQILNKFIYLYQ